MTVLVILIGGLATVLTLVAGLHKNRKVQIASTFFASMLILLVTGHSALQEWKMERTRETLLNDAYHRLFLVSHDLMVLVMTATVQASDGWVPSSISDLCSEKVAKLLCGRFDTSKGAPVIPPRSWLDYFANEAKRDKSEIDGILSNYGPNLDSKLTDVIIGVRGSTFLAEPDQLVLLYANDRQIEVSRPQTLCPLGNVMDPQNVNAEKMMATSLQYLRELYEQTLVLTKGTPVPMPADYETLRMDLGKARVSDDAIKKWEIQTSEAEKRSEGEPKGHFIPIKP